jgi:hypothetical protein
MISETLLEFFGHDNWPYLLDPDQYGIISAEITHANKPTVNSRILLKTESGNTWSVIRTQHTPPGLWEAVGFRESGHPYSLILYELPNLLSTLNYKRNENLH